MSLMKAVVFRRTGGPEVLEHTEVEAPQPAPGEALIRVRACALNHLDAWTRMGEAGRPVPLPHILGNDIAGIVEQINGTAADLKPGQRVMLSPGTSCGRCQACLAGEDNFCRSYRLLGYQIPGGYAEYVCCPLANVIPIPDSISFESAAAFPLVFLTAWHMLVTRAKLSAGETVLVWAAGSGVGSAAIQVAKLLGATVIATAGTEEKLAAARSLGADHTVNHRTSDVLGAVKDVTRRRGVDVVFEHVGAATWERSILSLAHGGRLVTCGATTGANGPTELRHLFAKQLSLLGSYMGSKAELLTAASYLFASRLRSVVDEVLPLARAREAHERLEASRHFGKIVLSV